MLSTPDSEIQARRQLGELQERIVHELRRQPRAAGVAGGGDG
jgi:hypothetical protein